MDVVVFIFITLIVQPRRVQLKSANGPAQAPRLVSGEWELDPSVDLTTETGETFAKLTARGLRPWVKTCGTRGLGMLVSRGSQCWVGERERRVGWQEQKRGQRRGP